MQENKVVARNSDWREGQNIFENNYIFRTGQLYMAMEQIGGGGGEGGGGVEEDGVSTV